MARFILFVIIAFSMIVFANFVLTGIAPLLHVSFSSGSGLSTVDFSLFDKNGNGRSYVTQGYGITPFSYVYAAHWHDGIDIAAKYGAPVYAPSPGIVLATGNQDNYCARRGFGRYVAIKDDKNGLVQWYAHLGSVSVSPGKAVAKGDKIGAVGASGFETGTHLHFSIFKLSNFSMAPKNGCGPSPNGKDVNPLSYLGSVYD